MDVRIVDRPATRLACIRTVGPYWEVVGPAFDRLFQIARTRGWFGSSASPAGYPLILASYLDSPQHVPLSDLRADVCIGVAEDVQTDDELTVRVMSAARYVVFSHVGPYAGLREAWSRAHMLIHTEQIPGDPVLRHDGECFEIYCNDPSQTAPAQLRTDIYLPIQ